MFVKFCIKLSQDNSNLKSGLSEIENISNYENLSAEKFK